jgi:hypothetical protein
MGLALDEPREDDERFDSDDLPIVMDPMAAKMVRESGGMAIRSTAFGPVAELRGMAAGGCC